MSTSNSSAYRPERRGDAQQPLHQVACPRTLADDRQRGDEPERADQERALLARQPVVGLVRAVAQHEAVLGQLVGDRQHAVAGPFVAAGQEPEDGRQQRRGIQRIGLVVLAQHAPIADAELLDVGADLFGDGPPLLLQVAGAADRRPAWPRDRGRPSTSASTRRSAAACRAPPRCPGRARARHAMAHSAWAWTSGQSRRGRRWLRRVCSRIESSAAPKTSFCR